MEETIGSVIPEDQGPGFWDSSEDDEGFEPDDDAGVDDDDPDLDAEV